MTAFNVLGIIIARPPGNHVIRGVDARTLTSAAGVIDSLDFALSQGAAKDLDLVEQAVKKESAARPVTKVDIPSTDIARSVERSREIAIDVHLCRRAVVGLRHMEPLVEWHRVIR